MVNRTGQGAAIPTLNRDLPALVRTPRVSYAANSAGADTSPAAFSLAQTLALIDRNVEDRLDIQAAQSARREGAKAGQSGVPALMDDATIRGRAFNQSARESVQTQFDLQARLKLNDLEQKFQNDPVKFKAAADGFVRGALPKLQSFDPEIAQNFEAAFLTRQSAAVNRITDRYHAVLRDQQQERALRLQIEIQDELQRGAAELFSGDPTQVRERLSEMTANAARLGDVARQIGPNGQPLFSASQRVAFETAAEDMVGEAFGLAWMQQQDSPIAAYYQFRKGEAMIEVADDEGNAAKVNLQDILSPRMYQSVQESYMSRLRSDLAMQNQIESLNEKAFTRQSDALFSDLSVLAQDGGLPLTVVEASRGSLEPDKYLTLRELAKNGGASISDGGTVARLTTRLIEGQDVRDEARAAFAGGDLTRDDYLRIFERSAEAQNDGARNAVNTGRDFVGGSLGRLSTELGFAQAVSIPQAEAEYEIRVQEFLAKNERQPTHSEALDIGREVVRRYSLTDIQNSFVSLPLPEFMPAGLKVSGDLNVTSLEPIINKTRETYLQKHNGDKEAMMADEAYRREADLLKEYYDRLKMKEEYDAK